MWAHKNKCNKINRFRSHTVSFGWILSDFVIVFVKLSWECGSWCLTLIHAVFHNQTRKMKPVILYSLRLTQSNSIDQRTSTLWACWTISAPRRVGPKTSQPRNEVKFANFFLPLCGPPPCNFATNIATLKSPARSLPMRMALWRSWTASGSSCTPVVTVRKIRLDFSTSLLGKSRMTRSAVFTTGLWFKRKNRKETWTTRATLSPDRTMTPRQTKMITSCRFSFPGKDSKKVLELVSSVSPPSL